MSRNTLKDFTIKILFIKYIEKSLNLFPPFLLLTSKTHFMKSWSILRKKIKKLIMLVFIVLPFSAIPQNNVIVGQNIETACGLTNVSAANPESAVDIWKDGC